MSILRHPWVADCGETERRLSTYVDGELGAVNRRRVNRHLVRCPGCRAAYEAVMRVLGGLRGLGEQPPVDASPSVVGAVLDRIRRSTTEQETDP